MSQPRAARRRVPRGECPGAPEPVTEPTADAWQLRVKLQGREERYRCLRPEGPMEIICTLSAKSGLDLPYPDPSAVEALTGKKVLRGPGWSVRRAPITMTAFASLPGTG